MRKLAVLFTAELYSHVTSLLRKESVMVVARISLLNTVLSSLKGICNLFTGRVIVEPFYCCRVSASSKAKPWPVIGGYEITEQLGRALIGYRNLSQP